MVPYLPPMQALRAFEAAARRLSYSRAAEELSLTHGAVSHHIARLERDLGGAKLFVRDGQHMLLTDVGQVLVLKVRQGLSTLAGAFEEAQATRAKDPRSQRPLTVSLLPSFAARWLVPRLPRFQASHPGIDIALRPTAGLARLDGRDGIDLAIRYGPGEWSGLKAEPFLGSTIFPVCSPTYRDGRLPDSPSDLKQTVLLRNPHQPWRPWFEAAGLDWQEPVEGPSYDDAGMILQAAVGGQGVALGRVILASEDLAAGRLVRLFKIEAEDIYGWHIVWHEPSTCDPQALATFRAWLKAEAAISDDIALRQQL